MAVRLTCPHCETEFKPKSSDTGGKAVRCPDCDRKFVPDEDRPRRSRGDNDSEDRPRRARRDGAATKRGPKRPGKKKKSRKTNPLLIILPVGGVAALAIVAVVLYFTVFRDSGSGSSGGPQKKKIDNELLAQVPDGVWSVQYVELDKVLQHPKLPGPIRRSIQDSRERTFRGIPLQEIEAYASGHGGPDSPMLVVKPKTQPVDRDRMISLTRGQPFSAQGRSFYKTNNGLMEFVTPSLVSFIPDNYSFPHMGGGPRGGVQTPFPALFSEVKGPIWSGGGTGNSRASGQSNGPEGFKQWEAVVRYSYTQITLGEDTAEAVIVTECASTADASTYAAVQEDARRRPGEESNTVTRSGTRVTVRKIRPIELAESILRDAMPGPM